MKGDTYRCCECRSYRTPEEVVTAGLGIPIQYVPGPGVPVKCSPAMVEACAREKLRIAAEAARREGAIQ